MSIHKKWESQNPIKCIHPSVFTQWHRKSIDIGGTYIRQNRRKNQYTFAFLFDKQLTFRSYTFSLMFHIKRNDTHSVFASLKIGRKCVN